MSKIYGYCRISTPQQNIERQVRNILREFPSARIYEESYTGTTLERPKFKALCKIVQSGDTIVFDEVSRMSRDAEEGFALYEKLFAKEVNLVFLKEPHINTETYRAALMKQFQMTGDDVDFILEGVNRYLWALSKEQIRLAFVQSQKEVDYLHQRTIEGIETARANGKQIGRPEGTGKITSKGQKAKDDIWKYSKDFNGMMKDVDIIRMLGCSRNSYYKWKNELKADCSKQK